MPDQPLPAPTPHRWTDPRAVDPAWAAPPVALSGRRRSPLLIAGVVALVLLLAVGGTWALGGFERRDDTSIPSAVGQPVTSGPYVFTFTGATVQQKQDFGGAPYWKVVVQGTVANTGTEALTPPAASNTMFALRDPATRTVVEPEVAKIGSGGYTDHSTVTPGLPATAYAVEFKFDQNFRPGPDLRFFAFQLEYGSVSRLGDEKTWHNGDRAYDFTLPVQTLAPDLN